MDLHEYATFDAVGLAELIDTKQVTPRELAECALAASDKLNPELTAVVQTYNDRIAGMDDSVPVGPFGGVPTMVKDLFHGEAGQVCENGSRLAQGWVVPAETEFSERVRRSGLVNVGRTATSEFGIMGTTETLAVGRTCSPWSPNHMAGGSSGGAASAVGAGIVPIATASDGGGSIRIPAASCGVVGLKPSRGRITWGPQIAEALSGWAVHFVVSRTVRDSAVALDALSGPYVGDPFTIAAPIRPYRSEIGAPVEPLRVAFCHQPWSGHEGDPQVAAATGETARQLEALGHHVEKAQPAFEWEPFLQAMTDVWSSDNAHTIDAFAKLVGREVSDKTLEVATLNAVEFGRRVSAVELMDAFDVANALARTMGWFFSKYDVLLTPTLGRLPAPLGVYEPSAATELRDVFDTWSPLESFLPVFNATGQPAISLPLHMSEEGLPIGMQLVGAFGAESLLLRLASQLEQAQPWAHRIPPIHASR